MLALGTRAGLAEVADRARLSAGVSRSPTVNPMGGAAVFSSVLVREIAEIAGAVLAAKTVTVKLVLLEAPPMGDYGAILMAGDVKTTTPDEADILKGVQAEVRKIKNKSELKGIISGFTNQNIPASYSREDLEIMLVRLEYN